MLFGEDIRDLRKIREFIELVGAHQKAGTNENIIDRIFCEGMKEEIT